MPKPKKYGPIDHCDRCGSIRGPLQIKLYKHGFEALCLECDKQHRQHEKQKNNEHPSPSNSSGPAGAGHHQVHSENN